MERQVTLKNINKACKVVVIVINIDYLDYNFMYNI